MVRPAGKLRAPPVAQARAAVGALAAVKVPLSPSQGLYSSAVATASPLAVPPTKRTALLWGSRIA